MKEFYKGIGILAIMLFSFYYTEKIALFMQKKDPIYVEIIGAKESAEVASVNAIIEGDYIIPGINGLVINEKKSFQKLKSFGVFNSTYLIFDQKKPEISLEENKNKIIRKGNKLKQSISILLEGKEEHIELLKKKNKAFSVLVNKDTVKTNVNYEQINNDFKYYKEVKKSVDSNICIVNEQNKDFCIKNKKYLIEPTFSLTSSNLASIKSQITSGSIILIKENVKVEDLDILLKQIDSMGLMYNTLSDLIQEKQ